MPSRHPLADTVRVRFQRPAPPASRFPLPPAAPPSDDLATVRPVASVDGVIARFGDLAASRRSITIQGAAAVLLPELVATGMSEDDALSLFREALKERAIRRGWSVAA